MVANLRPVTMVLEMYQPKFFTLLCFVIAVETDSLYFLCSFTSYSMFLTLHCSLSREVTGAYSRYSHVESNITIINVLGNKMKKRKA